MTEQNGRHEATGADLVPEDPTVPDTTNQPPAPALSAITRTRLYVGLVIVDAAAILFLGVGVILGAITGEQAFDLGTLVVAVMGVLNAGLSIGYRPTRPGAVGSP